MLHQRRKTEVGKIGAVILGELVKNIVVAALQQGVRYRRADLRAA